MYWEMYESRMGRIAKAPAYYAILVEEDVGCTLYYANNAYSTEYSFEAALSILSKPPIMPHKLKPFAVLEGCSPVTPGRVGAQVVGSKTL